MSESLLRLYPPDNVGPDGYPPEWHFTSFTESSERLPAVKDYVREREQNRCERCRHPYPPGIASAHPRGEWTPCDHACSHRGPWRTYAPDGVPSTRNPTSVEEAFQAKKEGWGIEAQWRILTVHHLNGIKWDCRWWNLAALCQRCHLTIQAKVVMDRVYPFEHSEWFKPHAAGWYAAAYLGEELSREEAYLRRDELLALERMA